MMENKGRLISQQVLTYGFLLLLILFALFPAVWMFSTSIKPADEVLTIPPKIMADQPTFSNYSRVLFESTIPRAFLNSVIVSVGTTLLTLLISTFAGYGFARFKFRGSGTLSIGLLFGQMLPTVVLVIPLYMIFSDVNLIDSYAALIIANLATALPMAVLLLTSFFRTVPRELEEAAKIDGTSSLGALFRIVLPNAAPGLVAVGVFSFINSWEEFLYALNFTNSATVRTLPIAISEFSGQFIIDWGGMMSASFIISAPVLLIFLLCNKYFIKGLSDGAVKG